MSIKSTLKIIGAVAPSSRMLACAMLRYYTQQIGPVLEVGAGTGAITKFLAKKVSTGQIVDVVEIMPQFAQILQKRYGSLLSIHHCNVLDFNPSVKYPLIISSLPLNGFAPDQVQAIIEKFLSLSEDGAILTFFEYKILQRFVPFALSSKELEQYHRTRVLIDDFISRYQFDEAVVGLNMPPAVVHYLRIKV